jgi:hypothetical protein
VGEFPEGSRGSRRHNAFVIFSLMVRWRLVIHPEVREWLHEIRKTDLLTAALIGQAIQHVIDRSRSGRGR